MYRKPVIMITFREGGENGGPYVSHKRIIESALSEKYNFVPLIIPKGRLGILNIKIVRNLVKQIKSSKPDIIHINGLQLEGFHAVVAAKICGITKTVLAIHGSSLEAINFPRWKKNILLVLENITLKMSKITYGVSDYVSNWENIKKHSKNHYGTIYNIPNIEEEVNNTFSIREELGLTKDKIIIVSTGRITKEKGFDVLSKVIRKMDIPSNVVFLIVGDGSYLNTFEKEIAEEGLEKQVFMLGYRTDIGKILSESDIFIICTLHETLCNSLLEAAYHSLPSVATNVGGIPEIITNDVTGYLVEKNDYLQFEMYLNELINNPDKRTKMGIKAKEKISVKFTLDSIIEKLDDMYRSVLNGPTP